SAPSVADKLSVTTVFAHGSATPYSRPLKAHCGSAYTRTLLYEEAQMRRAIRFSAMALLLLAACTEAPTAPERPKPSATPPDASLLTPFLLPPGPDWGQHFVSFN